MKIGALVTFQSHPFIDNNTSILISGEHLMITPIMVIVEILKIVKDEYSETDGIAIATKDNFHCKCIWFSSKNSQFEEAWFYSKTLNIIKEPEVSIPNQQGSLIEISSNLVGKLVAFKTLNLEVGKQKSSLSNESTKDISHRKTIISPLLSFVSPVMQITEIKENDSKDGRFDIKSGRQKKFTPKYNVKCKWYNPSGEKFSEKILPIDALLLLPMLGSEKLTNVQQYINGVATILKMNKSLVKPLSISYRSGYYYLSYFDFVLNITDEIFIDDSTILELETQLYHSEAPDFKLITSHPGTEWREVNTILNLVADSTSKNNYLRITYKDHSDKMTIRTLKNLVIHTVLEDSNPTKYLEAYCHLRKSKRYFKIDRIIKAQQMNLIYS